MPVADGWTGAEMRIFTLSNMITMSDGRRRTDGWTKLLIMSATKNGEIETDRHTNTESERERARARAKSESASERA